MKLKIKLTDIEASEATIQDFDRLVELSRELATHENQFDNTINVDWDIESYWRDNVKNPIPKINY